MSTDVYIYLRPGIAAVIDRRDLPKLLSYKWYACRHRDVIYVFGRKLGVGWFPVEPLGRVILGFPKLLVDHKDCNPLNNRRSNLRLATYSQNVVNRKRPIKSRTGFLGVKHPPGAKSYYAFICGRYIGSFKTAQDAARGYDTEAKRKWGEFARLNFK